MHRNGYFLAVLLLLGIAGFLYKSTQTNSETCLPEAQGSVKTIAKKKGNIKMSNAASVTVDSFEKEVLQSSMPVLVDFWAPWCGPCQMLGPTIDELAGEYDGKAKVVKVNVDENQQLASKYGVRGIPTIVFFKNGKEADRAVGVQSKQSLAHRLDKAVSK